MAKLLLETLKVRLRILKFIVYYNIYNLNIITLTGMFGFNYLKLKND